MHQYFIKTPWIVKQLFSSYIWSIPEKEKIVYLTFDDGPHPEITPWVLDQLKKHEALATFFCIGNNVKQFEDVYRRTLNEGHAIGNHTYHHVNGWKTNKKEYIADVVKATGLIRSNLFRPPYGRIKARQAKEIPVALNADNARIIMWDVLSADFDQTVTPQQCLENVIGHVEPGSIIVFHDSKKAYENLKLALPETLAYLSREGYIFKKIEI